MNTWKVILATLVIFGAGLVTGGLTVKRMQPPPATLRSGMIHQRVDVLKRMEKRLGLAPSQRDRIEQILSESQERTKKLWEQVGPPMREEFQRTNKRINEELTPEQKIKFEELLKEQRARHRPEDGPGWGERKKLGEGRDRPPSHPAFQDSPSGGPDRKDK